MYVVRKRKTDKILPVSSSDSGWIKARATTDLLERNARGFGIKTPEMLKVPQGTLKNLNQTTRHNVELLLIPVPIINVVERGLVEGALNTTCYSDDFIGRQVDQIVIIVIVDRRLVESGIIGRRGMASQIRVRSQAVDGIYERYGNPLRMATLWNGIPRRTIQ
ncbi:hypothetical protein N7474_009418 [Penicillium riverlandense]|uniref:uncharacterized protein n=1 Tax=Penicillium riverlandense TaxID=1903569 RepID=UPI002549B0BC|nr:uncharacterized protein N7474_009418 [Penicillium riverlandense]KAJ5808149.1 hypothetical protein N7474_009418 [Penicillium riverlandense]